MTIPALKAATKIEPCPFCGGNAQVRSCCSGEDTMMAWVECVQCGARSGDCEDAYAPTDQAIDLWNRRDLRADAQGAEKEEI